MAGDAARRVTPAERLPGESVRQCVGCRVRADRSVLLRVVAAEGDDVWCVVPDPDRRLPGRGANLHPDLGCLDLAERRSAFPRALRRSGPLDPAPVRRYLVAAGSVPPVAQERLAPNESSTSTVRAGSGSEADEHPMSTQP